MSSSRGRLTTGTGSAWDNRRGTTGVGRPPRGQLPRGRPPRETVPASGLKNLSEGESMSQDAGGRFRPNKAGDVGGCETGSGRLHLLYLLVNFCRPEISVSSEAVCWSLSALRDVAVAGKQKKHLITCQRDTGEQHSSVINGGLRRQPGRVHPEDALCLR